MKIGVSMFLTEKTGKSGTIALATAAAATKSIKLGTGICLSAT
jgi:alkanesulfonate monooxygenase SsuD/methylene tetrahydromethanopterin reductase-like flavin-dependent oxidoreductase (luciferase family)